MTVDQMSTVNIALRVGAVTERVTVTESRTGGNQQLHGRPAHSESHHDRVPMLTRNVFDLIQLSAGVTPANGSPNSSSSYAIKHLQRMPGNRCLVVHHQRRHPGICLLYAGRQPAGRRRKQHRRLIPAMEIPEDGVDEFRVETQNTPASYQSGGAGVISLVSKSGGDQFHGDAFVVFRPISFPPTNTSTRQTSYRPVRPTIRPPFIVTRKAAPSAAPSCTRSFFSLAIMRPRNRNCLTLQTASLLFPLPRNGLAIFPPTTYTIYNPLAPDG